MNIKAQAILAKIEAEKADIEWMKAENAFEARGDGPPRFRAEFAQIGDTLRNLAKQLEALETEEDGR